VTGRRSEGQEERSDNRLLFRGEERSDDCSSGERSDVMELKVVGDL